MAVKYRGVLDTRTWAGGSGSSFSMGVNVQGHGDGLPVGSFLLLVVRVSSITTTITTPTGWTFLTASNTGTGSARVHVYYQFTSAGGTPTWPTIAMSAGSNAQAFITAWSGVDSANPIDSSAAGTLNASPSSQAVAPSVTAVTAGLLVTAVIDDAASPNMTPPGGMTKGTELSDGTNGGSVAIGYEQLSVTGATGTRTWSTSTTTNNGGVSFVLKADGAVKPAVYGGSSFTGMLGAAGTLSLTGPTITLPTARSASDLLVYVKTIGYASSASQTALPTPSGWTKVLETPSGSTTTDYYQVIYTAPGSVAGTTLQISSTGNGGVHRDALFLVSDYNSANPIVTAVSTAATTFPATASAVAQGAAVMRAGYVRTANVTPFSTPSGHYREPLPGGTGTDSSGNMITTVNYVASASHGGGTVAATGTATSQSGTLTTLAFPPVNQLPNTPTLTAPANASTTDLATGPTFTATVSDPDPADTIASYALRRKIAGAGSYEYWNAGTSAWQGTEVFNAQSVSNGGTLSVTFGSGKWTNGNIYNWSFAVRDSQGGQSPYATDFTVTAGTAPTVTVTAPTGSVTSTSRPTVTWTYADSENDPQVTYQVKIFDAATYGGGGFNPASSTPIVDSGQVASASARSWASTVDLTNGTSYRAYVQSTQSGSQASAWAFSSFTMALDPPATPTLTSVTPDSANGRSVIVVQARDNILTANQASLETDTSGWANLSNCTLARSTAQFVNGAASLSMTAIAAGDMSVTTPTGTSGMPCIAGATYELMAYFRANTTARTTRIYASWYTAAGAFISDSAVNNVADVNTGFTQNAFSVVAPVNAAFVAFRIVIISAALGEVHYVDQISIAPGSSATWARGGLVGSTTMKVEYSDNGTTWSTVRGASAITIPTDTQQVTAYDSEILSGTTRQYRATTIANI